MKHKCTGWAIVATMERPDGTWYDETITEMDDDTASAVDTFLTEYCDCLLYTSPSPRDGLLSRMPSSA